MAGEEASDGITKLVKHLILSGVYSTFVAVANCMDELIPAPFDTHVAGIPPKHTSCSVNFPGDCTFLSPPPGRSVYYPLCLSLLSHYSLMVMSRHRCYHQSCNIFRE